MLYHFKGLTIMSNNTHIAALAAREDAQAIITGHSIESILKQRMQGGIVSDTLYTAYLIHYLPEYMQSLVLRVLESNYFEY